MNIALVKETELEAVCALYQRAIDEAHARGLYQWQWGEYPAEDLLQEDVAAGDLYGIYEGGALLGVFAVCAGQGEEYDGVAWRYGVKPVCLHRLAVDPSAGRRGCAKLAVAFCKEEGLRRGCDCFRVDTYAPNDRAMGLFASSTVREAGIFRLPNRPFDFHCFEAPLTADCPLLPFRMHPTYRHGDSTPWGGDGLRTIFGQDIPDDRTGEALEISAIPGLESVDDQGEPLPRLIERDGEALTGKGHADPFPLLLKLLCARTPLSVQVHPDDAYALRNEHKLGKTEAWVILHAEPGASLLYGIKEGVTLDDLRRGLESGEDIEPLIASVPVKRGDVLYMPSGMVHAIGGGILLYEIQQSSDVTYRLWDYNRVNGKGEKRPLHIRQSLDVIDPSLKGQRATLPAGLGEHTVLDVPAFRVTCLCADGVQPLSAAPDSFRMFTALAPLTLRWEGGSLLLKAGESALIPARAPALSVEGKGQALLSAAKA